MDGTPPQSRALLVTTDCGADMDDQWALAHIALSPEIDLRGVVTTHAPNLAHPSAHTSSRCVEEVLNRIPIDHIPTVLAGSSVPLLCRTPAPNVGVDFILEESRHYSTDKRLVILVLGAATDVASALLIEPTLGDRIEIVAMAFDGWPDGHDGFNVCNDVTSWQVLLESDVPITVGDAAVTRRDLAMTPKQARDLLADCGMAGAYLIHLLEDWLNAHHDLVEAVTGDSNAWPVWDEVTVAHVLSLTSVKTYPRPRLENDLSFRHTSSFPIATGQVIHWIAQVDGAGLWQHLRESLARALQS